MTLRLLTAVCIAIVVAGCNRSPQAGGPSTERDLVIYSTTDIEVFQPVIEEFERANPTVKIRYVDIEAADLDSRFRRESEKGGSPADLLLSASMDLQVRLVNEGFAQPHRSENAAALPNWARWRDEAIGFTFEPVVMVFNRRLMAGHKLPESRPQLLDALRTDPDFWRGRIGTYDVTSSSVGYLVASQDARQSSDFGALAEAFRDAKVIGVDTTSDVLRRIERGELVLGYNLLGSYARGQAEKSSDLVLVYPTDYTLAVARTAVIPKSAPNSAAAHQFLDYLLSVRGQRVLTTKSKLSAVRPEVSGPYSRLGITESTVGPLRPIALGPGLLVYLDQQKRERLLALWAGGR